MNPKIKINTGAGETIEVQQVIDNDLHTTDKTVVGAINEVLSKTEAINAEVLNGVSPVIYSIINGIEYRCTNTNLVTAPAITIPAMANPSVEFVAVVIFKAPNSIKPIITNNSGYPLKYVGLHVSTGVFNPVVGVVYRMCFVFDGIYVNCYISGVN